MPRIPPNYEKLEQKLWKENFVKVPTRLANNEANLKQKIATFLYRFPWYTQQQVEAEIKKGGLFSAFFTVEPRRQSPHERWAANWLKKQPEITDFTKLPAKGDDAWYLTSDGDIIQGRKSPGSNSMDFMWKSGQTICFASHKYIKQEGGHQSGSKDELVNLMRWFNQGGAKKNIAFFAITDGPYFSEERLAELKSFERDREPRSFACPIQDVPDHCINLK